jgi:undecaprenyl-diphosphatase
MSLFQALVLGLIQGLTEFLPISSSAHLVLAPWAFGWPAPGLAFDTLLHWGTLIAVLIYFRRDWARMIAGFVRSLTTRGPWSGRPGGRLADPDSRLAWWVVIGSVPAAVIGYAFEDFFQSLFNSPAAVGGFLLVTALILALSEWLGRRARDLAQMTAGDAILIGLAQAIAIAPGISRSGATMAAGLGRGLQRDVAARFSFLLATPAILGAGLLQMPDIVQAGNLAALLPLLLIGFLAAAISGYLCIHFLLAYLRRGKLYVFAGYCLALGLATLIATLA